MTDRRFNVEGTVVVDALFIPIVLSPSSGDDGPASRSPAGPPSNHSAPFVPTEERAQTMNTNDRTTFTADGVEVPPAATLRLLGMTRDEFIEVQRKQIADGTLHPVPLERQVATLQRESASPATRVVHHGARTIDVPDEATLRVLGLSADVYVATQKRMIDEGVL
ncbi:MAG: hypothetical protein IPG50_21745 [Myxococcales bacterium]|nr:hypothetical protein [Myxococcales bacterium]